MRAWNLEIVDGYDELYFSHPALFTQGKPEGSLAMKLEELSLALQSVIGASKFVEVIFNFPGELDLNTLDLPAELAPTVRTLSKPNWEAGSIVIPRSQYAEVIYLLKENKAQNICMKEVQGHLP